GLFHGRADNDVLRRQSRQSGLAYLHGHLRPVMHAVERCLRQNLAVRRGRGAKLAWLTQRFLANRSDVLAELLVRFPVHALQGFERRRFQFWRPCGRHRGSVDEQIGEEKFYLEDMADQITQGRGPAADLNRQRRFVLLEVVKPALSQEIGVGKHLAKGNGGFCRAHGRSVIFLSLCSKSFSCTHTCVAPAPSPVKSKTHSRGRLHPSKPKPGSPGTPGCVTRFRLSL